MRKERADKPKFLWTKRGKVTTKVVKPKQSLIKEFKEVNSYASCR